MDLPVLIVIVVVIIVVLVIAGSATGYVLYRKKKKQTATTPENTALEEGNVAATTIMAVAGTKDTKEAVKAPPATHPQDNEAPLSPVVAEEDSIDSSNKPQRKYTRRALSPPSLLADKLELGTEQEAMELFDKYMQAGIVDNTNKGFYSNAVATLRGTLKQSVRRQKSTRTTATSPSSPLDQMFAMVVEEEANNNNNNNNKHSKADRRTSIFNTLTRNSGGQRQKRQPSNPWSENETTQQ